MPFPTKAYAAAAPGVALAPYSLERRDVGPNDVHLKIKFCGICHSDLHLVRNEWNFGALFPMVPGHEIVGVVQSVGGAVTKLKEGEIGAVGCLVDSCRSCEYCIDNEEQHCPKPTYTYSAIGADGKPTYGGYSTDIVVDERFICKVPDALKDQLAGVAPLLCAGITSWMPMVYHGMNKPGKKIGVIGLGGLGHMAVKFGVAFGSEVTVISTSEGKREEAMKVLGASQFINSKDPKQMASMSGTLDFVLDTVAVPKDMNLYVQLLKPRGVLATVGAPPPTYSFQIAPMAMILGSKMVAGSAIGGLKATQEMLDFCGEKGITAMVEVIKMQEVNEAYERMVRADVRYRFSIDMEASAL